MCPCLCLVEVELCPSCQDFLLELQIFVKDLFQVQDFRLSVYQRKHDNAEVVLQRSVLVQLVHSDLRIRVTLELDNDTKSLSGGLISDI